MNKLKKLVLFTVILINTCISFSQKEANIWYFGENAGLDFNNGNPVALVDGRLVTEEGCASISDANGDLLFYSDGITVWNRNHNIMPNGTYLNGDYSSTNSALIIPRPGFSNIYYIFTLDKEGGKNGLQYSEVDLSLDGGLGAVTSNKNVLLYTPTTEQVTAIKNPLADEYWVISHKWTSEFIAYRVSNSGVNTVPVVSDVGPVTSALRGDMKVSPNGRKLAANRKNNGYVGLFDFNPVTGVVSNNISINVSAYGIEFSSNNKLLYTSSFNNDTIGLLQFNIETNNETIINNSKVLISDGVSSNPLGALQLAPDGKIYLARSNSNYVDVINSPNLVGLACNYQHNAINLNGATSRLGLPPFIQSFFKIDEIDYSNTCYGDNTEFLLPDIFDSLLWNFGDPASGVNNTSVEIAPTHVFSAPGIYEVSVTATVGGNIATETTSVTIYEQSIATKPYDILLCDLVGDISLDLERHSVHILNGIDSNVFGVNYYEGMTNYTNGIKIDSPEAYTNSLSFFTQKIIAEVYNKQNLGCTDITEFNIGIFKTPQLEINNNLLNLTKCDDANSGSNIDGVAEFDLTEQEQYLLLNGVDTEVHYNYFTDTVLSQSIVSPNSFVNTENPQIIYVEGVNNANSHCKTTTSFIIEVLEIPSVTPVVELKQCDEDLDGFFSAFNLNEVINEIRSNGANETVTFHESVADAENNNNPILNPTTYSNQIVGADVVWARVENNKGCFRTSQINLTVTTTQIPITFGREFYMCDDNADGVSQFDFSNVDVEIEGMFPVGQQLTINYYRNEADALAEEKPIGDISNYRNIGYPNNQEIYVRVDGQLDNDCLGLGAHINLFVEPIPIANPVSIERQCDDDQDGKIPFDTSLIQTNLLINQSLVDVTVTYFDENNNSLPSPLPNPFVTSSQLVTTRVTNNSIINGSCYDEAVLEFIVDKQPIAYAVPNQISCDNGIDSTYDFDTSLIEELILNGQTDMEIYYYNDLGEELPSPLPNPFNSDTQTITVEVVNLENPICTDTTKINFIVNPSPDFSIETPQIVCSSHPTSAVILDPVENNILELYDYEWVNEDGILLSNAPILAVSTPGAYSITLTKTDGTGCSRTSKIFVNASELATLTIDDITIVDASNNNTITINTNNLGQGDYEFALDDEFSFYQDKPSFSNVSSGIHTIYVRDKSGCGTNAIDISVIGFPKYFTPNGDGNNDYWQVKGVNNQFQATSDIYIYDRYGKLLKQLTTISNGWDGTFNGNMLPSDDYWFSVSLEDGRIFKGHFTLKR